jgi:hypothetical protein
MKNLSRVLYILLTLGSLLGGILCLGFGLLPFTLLKQIGDRLSKDGDLVSFTPGAYSNLHLKILAVGIILLLAALFCILRAQVVKRLITQVLTTIHRFASVLFADARKFRQDLWNLKISKCEWAAIGGITISAALLRLPFMYRLLDYDEAYTFAEFARYSLGQVISDYSLPNNHIFHTILVHFSFRLFGNTAFAIRLPVLICGLILIPCVYLLAQRFYNKTTAFLAAGFVTTYPLLILKSTSARGYILIALLVVIGLLLGEYLAVRKNYFGWLLWSLCIALGFYTNPSMIYPFSVLFLWMALRLFRAGPASAYPSMRERAVYLVSFSILASLITILFYLPVFFTNGVLNFFNGAHVVDSLPMGSFLAGFPDMLGQIAVEWNFAFPDWMRLLLAAGLLLALVFSWRDRRGGTLLLIAFPVAIGVMLLVQRPVTIARIWLWAVPMLLIWAAAGFTGLLLWLTRTIRLPSQAVAVILSVLIIVFLTNAVTQASLKAQFYSDNLDVENITLYLKTMVTADDIVVVSENSDAQFLYYFDFYHVPEISIRKIKNRPFNHAFVVVYPAYKGETMQKVLSEHGPDYGFPDMSAGKLLASIGSAKVYEIDPNPATMQKLFGQPANTPQK